MISVILRTTLLLHYLNRTAFLYRPRSCVKRVILTCLALASILVPYPGPMVLARDSGTKLPPEIIDFEHLTIKDGLANMVIYDILQDKQGFLWLSTGTGISRYDGYQFKNYLPDKNNPDAIGKGPALRLYIDRKDRLWVTVLGSGLFCYDGSGDRFIRFQHDPENPHSISSNNPYALTEDDQGFLWVTTIDAGVNRFDESTGHFERFRHDPDNPNSISGNRSFGIFKDSRGDLWIDATGKSINHYDIHKKKWTHYMKGLSQAPWFMEDRHGDMWISILGRGIARFDRDKRKFKFYRHNESDPYSLSHNMVSRAIEDSQGVIWLVTWGGGLNAYDRKLDRFIRFKSNPQNPHSLASDDLFSIYQDRTGVLWVGTYGAGLDKYDRKSDQFSVMRTNVAKPDSLSHNNIKSIFQDSRGEIWIGTLGGGLNRYNPESQSFRHYRYNLEDPHSLSNDHVWKVTEDHKGNIWVATLNGLNRYDRKRNRFTRYRHDPQKADSIGHNVVRSVFVDRHNTLWLGLQLGGIDRYDPQSDGFKHYPTGTVYNSAFFEDSAGNLWVGNLQGLYRYEPKSNAFELMLIDAEDPSSGFKEFTTTFCEDRSGNLWIGRNNGLSKYNLKTGQLTDVSARSGVENMDIAGIIEDQSGQIWISTAGNLTVYTPETGRHKHYDLGTFNRGAFEHADSGELYFGSTNGLLHFHATDIRDNLIPPPIVLTAFKKFDQEAVFDKPLTKLTSLSLSHEDRFFSIEFSALDFSEPLKNRYQYKLEGFDPHWHEVGSDRRIATYTNLDGGDYTFRVIGSNNDGVWNEKGATLEIVVTPPFWKTWWYITLCIIFVLGLFGLIYRVKTTQLRKVNAMASALTESEEKYRNVVENAIEAICVIRNDRFRFFNPQALSLFGYSTAELYNLPVMDLIHPEDRKHINSIYRRRLRQGIAISFSIRIMNRTKEEIWTDAKAVRFYWDNKPAVLVFLSDITEKRKSFELMIQTEKMMSLGGLAAGMAHELNNPLGGMLQGAQNIRRRLSTELKTNMQVASETGLNLSHLQAYLEKRDIYSLLQGIQESGKKASEIITNMLQFSRKSESKLAPTDLIQLMENTLDLAGKDYNLKKKFDFRSIEIIREFEPELPSIPCTETEIEQVLLNLLKNAAWAMMKNPQLTPHQITLRLGLENKFARIEVEDNGPGMDKKTRNRIFEPFFTTKPVGEGTGLGLSISYMIITQNHQGTLEVESEPGKGARFIIRLPLVRETEEQD